MQILGYDISKAKKPKPTQNTVGIVGMKTASGIVEEEFIRNLRWPDCGKIYSEMSSNDAIIGACLYLIETIVRGATWKVEAQSDTGEEIDMNNKDENVIFLESCMHDMGKQSWDDFICEAMTMLPFGFSFFEVTYKVRRGPEEKDSRFRSKFSDGKVGWQELSPRSQATLQEWTFDTATGKAIEFIQDTEENGTVAIPLEGNLLLRTKSSRDNPEGWSILRRAYRSWYFKRYIEELEGVGIERSLAGMPLLQPAENVPLFDKDNKQMVELFRWSQDLVDGLRQDSNHGVIIPFGWTLKLIGPEGTSNLNVDTTIRRHEARMAMALLADVVLLGGDRTGSFALAEVKQSLLISSLKAIVNGICNSLNTQIVPILFQMNSMPLENLPKIVAVDLEEPDIKEVALLLRSAGFDVTKNKDIFNFIMKLINAPELDDAALALLSEAGKEENKPGEPGDEGELPDTVDNDAKQSDLDYM